MTKVRNGAGGEGYVAVISSVGMCWFLGAPGVEVPRKPADAQVGKVAETEVQLSHSLGGTKVAGQPELMEVPGESQ